MKQHDKFIDFLHNLETRTGEHSLFEAVRKGYNAIFESEQEHPTMVFVVKFDNAEQASEEEYFLRDGWGSECNSVVDGDTVYVEATPKLAKILPSWFDGKDLTLKEAPASIAKKLHGDYLGEAVERGYDALFESHFDDPKMEKAIETACEIAGVDDEGDLSDGNHTFNDLYHQRCILFATLVNLFPEISWKTKRHDDGELCFGGKNFLVCIDTPAGPYSYHYPMEDWDKFECQEIEQAKPFDGHTDKDVERLFSLVDMKK